MQATNLSSHYGSYPSAAAAIFHPFYNAAAFGRSLQDVGHHLPFHPAFLSTGYRTNLGASHRAATSPKSASSSSFTIDAILGHCQADKKPTGEQQALADASKMERKTARQSAFPYSIPYNSQTYSPTKSQGKSHVCGYSLTPFVRISTDLKICSHE